MQEIPLKTPQTAGNAKIEHKSGINMGRVESSYKEHSTLQGWLVSEDSPKGHHQGGLEFLLILHRLTEELNFTHLALRKAVLMLVSPFHESQLDCLVTVNGDEVAIFILIA
jgi:hypothetical protein